MKQFLSKRGQSYVRDMSPLMQAHYSTQNIRYNPETRPDGHINLGTAETHLINNEVIDILYKIQKRMEITPEHLHYDYFYGSDEFREAIANHWQKLIFGENSDRKITPDNIAIGSGCSLALEMLATMLGNAGDVILVAAPYYSGFIDDFSERAKIELVGVDCGPELTKSAFEEVLKEQKAKGKNVVAILYSSPNNPVGTVYRPEDIKNAIDFAMENNLEIISDEIYAQTIHDQNAKWVSTLNLVPEEYIHHVHVTSSFAKDFALSGFRTGFAISFNTDLIKGMQNLSYFSGVSTHTQAVLTQLLKAPELPELLEKNREQLRISHDKIVKGLKEIGVKTLPAQGGIFVFADFSPYMEKNDFDYEMKLWEKIFGELKINITPGKVFGATKPGYFRVCYALPPSHVDEACRRLATLQKTN